ncbi:unnamed protein product [Mesocestoides corti]|nr:unnamed protein product [Mesocestoides corti]
MTLISSSSNDEGFSKAYFQRLQERGHSRGPILLPADELSRGFYRDRRQHKVPFGAANSSSEWGQEDFHNREKLRIGKSPTERLVPKHWLQKITSVPEIRKFEFTNSYFDLFYVLKFVIRFIV